VKWTVHEKEQNIMEKTCRTDIAWFSFYGLSDYLISFLSILRSFISIGWLLKHKKRKTANMKAYIYTSLYTLKTMINYNIEGKWGWMTMIETNVSHKAMIWTEYFPRLDHMRHTYIHSMVSTQLTTSHNESLLLHLLFASCLDKEQANHHSDVPDTQLFNPSVQRFYVYAIFFISKNNNIQYEKKIKSLI